MADHRAKAGRRIERIARDIEFASTLGEAAHECVMNIGMDEQARPCVADLSRIIKNAHDGAVNRCIHIFQIRHENLRAFAARFQRDALEIGLPGIDHQLLANRG